MQLKRAGRIQVPFSNLQALCAPRRWKSFSVPFSVTLMTLSFRKLQRPEDLLPNKGYASFGYLANPDDQITSALDYPLRSCDALSGHWLADASL